MKIFIVKNLNNLLNGLNEKEFIVISSTGGSGSSYLIDQLILRGFNVCVRPDGGEQKINVDSFELYKNRTRKFFQTNLRPGCDDADMFNETIFNLNKKKRGRYALVCMNWGLKGFFSKLGSQIKPIYLVRNPLFAFNSYSGLGWRKDGGSRRISGLGFDGPNDLRWVNAWLEDFAHWEKGAKIAIDAARSQSGHLVRYHKMNEDFCEIPNFPVLKKFYCKDSATKINEITDETIDYIKARTDKLWHSIDSFAFKKNKI
tara:strand:+ start:5479 stop:6252 length:774 start_codon:yes stop_codon:yes gene_type:complete